MQLKKVFGPIENSALRENQPTLTLLNEIQGAQKTFFLSYNSNLTYLPPKGTNMYCNHIVKIIFGMQIWSVPLVCHKTSEMISENKLSLIYGDFFNGGRKFLINAIDGRNII